jgi:[ribosomal protein S18]-alanine N-acetyltransferase
MYKLIVPDPESVPAILSIADECNLSHWTAQAYIDELQRTDSIAFTVVSEHAETAGFIIGRTVPGSVENCLDAEIYNIAVRPNARRAGLGKVLVNSFTDSCITRGVENIWLEVRISNSAAISFYESHGFLRSSIRKEYYKFPEEDAVLMKLALQRT